MVEVVTPRGEGKVEFENGLGFAGQKSRPMKTKVNSNSNVRAMNSKTKTNTFKRE